MEERIRRDAKDPDVVRATAGLAAYLRELVVTARRPVRDRARYDARVWLGELPEGVERPSVTADGVLLALDHIPRIAPPALPEALKEWVDHDARSTQPGRIRPWLRKEPARSGQRTRTVFRRSSSERCGVRRQPRLFAGIRRGFRTGADGTG